MADSVVEASCSATIENSCGLWGPYWISPTVGALVALDNGDDVNIYRTNDSGSTWTLIELDLTGAVSVCCFFDKEVPGDSGNLLHIWWLNGTNGVLKYCTFNLSTGFFGTIRTIATIVSGEGTSVSSMLAACKTRNGNLLVAGRVSAVTNTIFHYRSTDAGANWTSRAAIWENVGADCGRYFPANTGDGADAALMYLDDSATELSVKMYDDSADTVTETSVRTSFDPGSVLAGEAQQSWDAALRHSDGLICYAGWNLVNNAAADINTGTVNPNSIAAPTVANTTDVVQNTNASGGCAVAIDQNSDEVYVAYLLGGTWQDTVDLKFKKSSDAMSTWGTQQNYSEDAADDYRRLTGPRSITDVGGIIQWAWFDNDDSDIFVNLTNDVVITGSTTSISGVVTLNSSPVQNASVIAIDRDTGEVYGPELTDVSGAYAFTLPESHEFHVVVEYESGGQKYRALSHWSISPVV